MQTRSGLSSLSGLLRGTMVILDWKYCSILQDTDGLT